MPHLSPIMWTALYMIMLSFLMMMIMSMESANPSLIKK